MAGGCGSSGSDPGSSGAGAGGGATGGAATTAGAGLGAASSSGGSGASSGTTNAAGVSGSSGGSAGAGGSAAGDDGGDQPEGGVPAVACESMAVVGTPTVVTIDGNDIKTSNVNGLTFKGFGVLSANGTSELLLDYKAQHPERYAELLQILFGGERPIMTQVKIEMGNDRNNSTGPDPATMRLENEAANVRRAQGFQLAADAKQLNPKLKVGILRWNAPGWASTNDDVYAWFKATILAAYRTYGYMVDYVNPGLNEREPDLAWTKQYANRVKTDTAGFENSTEQALYNAIKVVISDEAGLATFGDELMSDAALRGAVAVAGYHYNTDDDAAHNFTKAAEQLDKEVWNSEAQATFGNAAYRVFNNAKDPSLAGTGLGGTNSPLEMGNTIVKGFVQSRRTHFVYQPAIGSFYEGGQFSFKELLSARDPWSGWIHYDAGLQILRHFSWFSKAGWENADNTAGIWRVVAQASATGATGTNPVSGRNGTPSYLTLAAPDKHDFSSVLVNDSEKARTYQIKTSNLSLGAQPPLELWETRAAEAGESFNRRYLKYVCSQAADASGSYTITVKPFSIVTATTLPNTTKAAFQKPLPVEPERAVLDTDATGTTSNTTDELLYADDFDYSKQTVTRVAAGGALSEPENYVSARGGEKSVIPRYFCDRNGAFEAFLTESSGYVLRQQVDQATMGLGGAWNPGDPITAVGDNRWLDYKASVDVSFEHDRTESGKNYAALGARQQGGENSHTLSGTPYVLKFTFDGGWQLLVDGSAAASGNVVSGTGGVTIANFKATPDAWHNLALSVVANKVTAFLDGTQLAQYTDTKPRLSGRVDLASGFYYTRFDNLKVELVDGGSPYYTELLDNLEMSDLAPTPSPKLVYGGAWAHENGKGMYQYQRSLSTSQSAGATLKYAFNGSGLDVLGANDGSAKLEVSVDGKVTQASAATKASSDLYQTFTLRGLGAGPHTVQLKLLSGKLVVDALGVVR